MRHLISIALVALLLAISQANAAEREFIYGAELMSPKERETYRQRLKSLPDHEARGQYRQRHRERLQKRAQQRGVQFDERGVVQSAGRER